jgi:dephospho-CoA kinase
MLLVGLTGGIGSGKSIVAEIFRTLGIPVLDADKLAKKIIHEDEDVRRDIIKTFGEETFIDGKLNIGLLAKIVFRDPNQLRRLNDITHPRTIAAGYEWAKKQVSPYVVKEAALFFESGSAEGIDKMIGVTAPKALRIQRVMQRDKVDREEVLARMSRQIDDSIKMRLCDWVIRNDEQEPLLAQVLAIHEKLLN